jgi:predicted phosphohydrolase
VILREKERIRREILEILKSKDDVIEMFAKKVVSDDLTRQEAVLEVLKKILK